MGVPRAAILLLYSLALHPRVHSIYAGVPYCSSPWLAMEHGTNATELFALVGGDRYGPPAKAAPRASSNLPQPYILYAIHASQRINLGTTAQASTPNESYMHMHHICHPPHIRAATHVPW